DQPGPLRLAIGQKVHHARRSAPSPQAYTIGMLRALGAIVVITAALAVPAGAQVPAPFPRPGQPPGSPPPTPAVIPPPAAKSEAPAGQPSEQVLGAPLYPSAQFIASYDAGQGQRYYLFGSETDFAQIVTFYK